MDAAGFQILCDDYLSRAGYPNVVSLGTMAGAQRTTRGTPDTYFPDKKGRYVFAEYTVQREKLKDKIKSDIEKCFNEEKTHVPIEQISEIVYCHTSSNISPSDDSELKKYCSERGVLLTIIGIDKLADDIFWKYQILAKEHLGLSIDTGQILTAEDYIKKYDSNELAAPLETVFMGREAELKALTDAFINSSVVIVTGSAGVGKTRLAIEFAKKHASENEELLYCIHSRALGLFDDINMYFSQAGNYFLVVDDANQITDLSLIIDLVNTKREGFSFRLLLTVRDYAITKVKKALDKHVKYEEIKLDMLKDDEIKALVAKQYDIHNELCLKRIAAIAEGNARMAIWAGKLASEEGRLDVINDASQLYEEYYGPVLRDIGLDSDIKCLSSLGVVAFLGALHVDHIEPILPILASSGIDKDTFLAHISYLSDIEMVDVYQDKAVRISEQCMGNFLLKYVFCERKLLSLAEMIKCCFFPYKERTNFAVRTLMSVFHSADTHNFVCGEIQTVWQELKACDHAKYWSFLRSFYPADPVAALVEIKTVVDNTTAVSISADEIDTEAGKNYRSVDDDVISMLCGYADTEDLEAALDLFFQYYLKRPDMYMQFYHASISSFSINRHSDKNEFQTQILYLTKIAEYSSDWDNDFIIIFFLEVAKEFLRLEFTPLESESNGKGIAIYRVYLNSSRSVAEYRKLIWIYLEKISKSGKHHDKLRKVFSDYGCGVAECSFGVVQEDAPSVSRIVTTGFSPDNIEDCRVVAKIDARFKQCNVSINEFQPFLTSPNMKAYQALVGPGFSPDYDFEKHEARHNAMIKDYIVANGTSVEAFSRLLTVYSSIERSSYEAAKGINVALQMLSTDKETYVEAVRLVLANGKFRNLNINAIVRSLFSLLSASSVLELIQQNACNPITVNNWVYAYYHELPDELVDEYQLEGLYHFLMDKSDASIQEASLRDIFFLQKYLAVDKSVFPKACKIILNKKDYSPFIVNVYLSQLFISLSQFSIDLAHVFEGHIDVLEDIYFFLLQQDANHDDEGTALSMIAKMDASMPKRLAAELLLLSKNHKLYHKDTRFSALYELDNYIEIIDGVINEAIHAEEHPIQYVPDIIKQFLPLPEKRSDVCPKMKGWVQHYIIENSRDKIKMGCLFDAVPESSLEFRREMVCWFVQENICFEDFKNLPLLPISWGAMGSLVPVYNRWNNYLNTLLPLFHGLDYLQHKQLILNEINRVKAMIVQEEISNFITG